MIKKIQLWNGDCLELLKNIPDKSIDLILTDPPYGTTACNWDTIIPFDLMWEQLNRVIKDNGAIVLFGSEPFSSALRMSNIKNFKYDWYWNKNKGSGFLNAKKMPLKNIEQICIFYKKTPVYNPQFSEGKAYSVKDGKLLNSTESYIGSEKRRSRIVNQTIRYPKTLLNFKIEKGLHPTQKPVPLLEYLIKTYTKENETVLDFTMGSGSTGVACINTNRNFIGIELDKKYFEIAQNRIKDAQKVNK